MGRYTGPKGRINRRLGAVIFENIGAQKAFENRDYPPGPQQRRRKLSEYGISLKEKQKIKYTYGLREREFRVLFNRALKAKGITGDNLMIHAAMAIAKPPPRLPIRPGRPNRVLRHA